MDNLNFGYGNCYNLANAGAVAGTTSTLTTTAATLGVINGKFAVPFAAQANTPTPVVDGGTGKPFVALNPGMCCSLVFGQNTAGALIMLQGTPIAIGAGTGATPGPLVLDPQFPGMPQDFVAFAYTVVRTAPSAAPWTPGTSSWTAAGVVASAFQNVSQLANRPQAF